ncbi:hypothetical protein MMC25_003909 [Agyrium rufum]|nr:hypothetical protein [Agyrium rufum]
MAVDMNKTSGRGSLPISISRRIESSAPPPLPPPSGAALSDIVAQHHDPGWAWANAGYSWRNTASGSISPASSLARGSLERPMAPSTRAPPRLDDRRRDSAAASIRSPPVKRQVSSGRSMSEAEIYGPGIKDEGYSSLSGSSLVHRLLSERPLEQRSRQNSSNAYDSQLLSKINPTIGRIKTPPPSAMSGSASSTQYPSSPPIVPRFEKPKKAGHYPDPISTSERSFSNSSESPMKSNSPKMTGWLNSPQSSVVTSPHLISVAASARSLMERTSPTSNWRGQRIANNGVEPPYLFSSFGGGRHSTQRSESDASTLVGGFHRESTNRMGQAKRGGSYDQSIFTPDFDSDFPIEETGGMRHLQLDERAGPLNQSSPPDIDISSPEARLGMKRRASSPLTELGHHDDKLSQLSPGSVGGTNNDLFQRRTSGHLTAGRASPKTRYHPKLASVSSTSSSDLRNGSYASSAGVSLGGSSMTSFSSYDRPSPVGISPSSDYPLSRDQPYQVSHPLEHVQHALSQAPSNPPSGAPLNIITQPDNRRNMSSDQNGRMKDAPKLQSNLHICPCCPKKPKRFDTAEELHQHISEKQYKCLYCENRFKNKNEAERHQNSLHLRRNSWSCAKLAGSYQEAFHPCNAIPPNTNPTHAPPPQPDGGIAPYDVCGYCGTNFSNHPTPDWEARINHLTGTHKFGECNQGKKFFRADHFRQHLKHSHGGTSGKWTNMLEEACRQEEPPLTPEAVSQEQARAAAQQAQQAVQMQQAQQAQQAHQQQQALQQPMHGYPPPPGAPIAPMLAGGPPPDLRAQTYMSMPLMPLGQSELQFPKIEEE